MAQAVRNKISFEFPNGIKLEKGVLYVTQEPFKLIQAISGLIAELLQDTNTIELLNGTEKENELLALGNTLLESLLFHEGKIKLIAPVCPDYAQESSDAFYQTIGSGVSPQANAAIKASQIISHIFPQYGFSPSIEILVADTEDDLSEVMHRCVNDSPQEYFGRCLTSSQAIQQQVEELPSVTATTFTQALGNDFRITQYAYEGLIKDVFINNPRFARELQKMGDLRGDRHAKILGRAEVDYELTIRYMAQYAALGSLSRGLGVPTILLNYPTPNLTFFNAVLHKDPALSLSQADQQVLPIIETIL